MVEICCSFGWYAFLTSFDGSVGKLMSRSGLEEIMSPEFVGVKKILNGKKFSINISALRISCLEFLRGYVDDVKNYYELENILDQLLKVE